MAKIGKTRFAILGVLTLAPQSGYEIAKFCREVLSAFWRESYGQIYPQLEQLLSQKLIKKAESRETNRRKAIYTITPKGRKVLSEWMVMETEPQPVRNETLLKVFFGADMPIELSRIQVAGLLDSQRRLLGYLKEIEKQIATLDEFNDSQKKHFRMTVRMGVLVAQARVKWANECLEIL